MKKVFVCILSIILLVTCFSLFTIFFELNYKIQSYDVVNVYDNVNLSEYDENNATDLKSIRANIIKPTVLNCIKAYLNPNVTIERKETLSNDMLLVYSNINQLFSKKNMQNAISYAYKYANKELKVVDYQFYVFSVMNEDVTTIKYGDEILEIDSQEIKSIADIDDIVLKKNLNDTISVKVRRGNEEITFNTVVVLNNGDLSLGVSVFEIPVYEFLDESITFLNDFDLKKNGSFATSLALYEQLVGEKLISDKSVLALGDVEDDGTIVSNDDILKYFLTAMSNGIDMVLVPNNAYQKVMELKNEKKSEIQVIAVDNVEDAINMFNPITYYDSVISFSTDSRTGYEWDCSSSNSKVLKLEKTNNNGVSSFKLVGQAKGNAKVTCNYKRSWEETAKDVTKVYNVNVSKKLKVTYEIENN